jgi:hypothetical protein
MRAFVVSASSPLRQAERVCDGALAHDPPRTTRCLQPGLNQARWSRGARR